MNTALWTLVGSLGTAAVLIVVVVLYGRSRRSQGRSEAEREEAEGNAEKRSEVAQIGSHRTDRRGSLARLKRLLDSRGDLSG